MKSQQANMTILMADDDENESMLVQQALAVSQLPVDLQTVSDGDELMDYLYQRGQYSNQTLAPRPSLILLDLNMPKKGGLEVLAEIKTNIEFRLIPIIIWTTLKTEQSIYQTYNLGANSYIIKPMTLSDLIEMMETIGKYWFGIVELPHNVIERRNQG